MNTVWSVKWVIFSGGKQWRWHIFNVFNVHKGASSAKHLQLKLPPTSIQTFTRHTCLIGRAAKWIKWYGNKFFDFFLPFLKKQLWSSFVHFPHEVLCQNIFSPPSQHISDIFWPRCIKQSNMKLHKFCSNSIGQTFVLQIPHRCLFTSVGKIPFLRLGKLLHISVNIKI